MTISLRLGRAQFFLWSGTWHWRTDWVTCPGCWNRYLGPFGWEWSRR